MPFEGLKLLLVFLFILEIILFGYFWKSRIAKYMKLSLPASFSLVVATIALSMSILGLAGVPSLIFFQVFIYFSIAGGAYEILRKFGTWRETLGLFESFSFKVLIFSFPLFYHFISKLMEDLYGLPTMHDGMAHTLFFSRILEFGTPILTEYPKSFDAILGKELYPFYPTGTHTILAVFFGWPSQLDLIHRPELIKLAFITLISFLPYLSFKLLQATSITKSNILIFIGVLVSILFYRYPFWAIDSGGISRILATLMYIPLFTQLLRDSKDWKYLFALIFIGIPTAYMIHPSAWYTSVIICAFVSIILSINVLRKKSIRVLVYLVIAWTSAVFLTLLIHINSGMKAEGLLLNVSGISQGIEWGSLAARFQSIVLEYFHEFRIVHTYEYRKILLAIGLISSPFLIRRSKAIGTLIAFCYLLPGLSIALYCFGDVSFQPIQILLAIFFKQAERIGETFYLSQTILRFTGVVALAIAFKRCTEYIIKNQNITRRLSVALTIVSIVFISSQNQRDAKAIKGHFNHWFGTYNSPFTRNVKDTVSMIEKNTEESDVLIYEQYQEDVVSLATKRRGMFVYHECPVPDNGVNCLARLDLVHRVFSKTRSLANDNKRDFCYRELEIFKENVFVIYPEEKIWQNEPCLDGQKISTANGKILIKVKKQ